LSLIQDIGKDKQNYTVMLRHKENLTRIGKAMLIYAGEGDDKYPIADKWCDLLIKYVEVTPETFRCRGASEGRCNYAMNKNIEKLGIYAHPDMVLLFESKPGWNQFGGPEILTFENHKGKRCNILFNDGHVEFVKPEQISKLNWKVE
jgi:prepilin-type processing-associated H-X9-DG protein